MASKNRKLPPLPLQPEDWPTLVRPGSRVFLGSYAATPLALINSLLARPEHLVDVELVHLLTLGDAPWVDERLHGHVDANALYLGPGLQQALAAGHADYTPAYAFEIPSLFRQRILALDVALVQVTPPDKSGRCSLGISCDITRAAVDTAPLVVAQVNPRLPRTAGETLVEWTRFAAVLQAPAELPEVVSPSPDEIDERIAAHVALLVEDESTLRIGSTAPATAIAAALREHQHLGIHSDRLGDSLHALLESGAVTNKRKGQHNGVSVAAYAVGSRALYDFVDGNKKVLFLPSDYVNHPATIALNRRMVAIAGAQQVDLTGQVVDDSIGHKFVGGFGGQTDFLRGAALCPDGRPIVALRSTAPDGSSRIVTDILPGSGIVASRGDVHYVVTEYGIATLRGRSIRERALELIQIAHPDHRADLLAVAKARRWVPVYEKPDAPTARRADGLAPTKLVLKKERYVLRPLQPSDERRLQEFFYSHTQETIQSRYGYMVSRMSRERAYELVNVDQTRDLALGVLEVQGPREVIHAVGRYYLDADARSAEVAFVTRETKRRCGLSRALFERLRAEAKKRGLASLHAQVAPENAAMLGLFQNYPHKLSRIPGTNAVHVEMPL
ncbi:MAG TPA: acetyl-CoA hydrolase/transferase C-terminal domain-containing protein [Opitutaceae bacterium]|nr:acetyl-CoA hydrolase/transferase C-terminal domain-containing protein [Opitutaceae bacterium]